jgi:hypothetical protein
MPANANWMRAEEALRWAQEALAHATAQSAADPKSPVLRDNVGASREIAVRLQWLVSGERGDYRSLFGQEATPGQIRADLASAWVQWAGYLGSVESPWPAQVEALRTAGQPSSAKRLMAGENAGVN